MGITGIHSGSDLTLLESMTPFGLSILGYAAPPPAHHHTFSTGTGGARLLCQGLHDSIVPVIQIHEQPDLKKEDDST